MNEQYGIILVSSTTNSCGTYETNKGGEIIRRTRYSDSLESFISHATDKEKWQYQNTHACFIDANRRRFSKPKYKPLKITCANCQNVNTVYGGYTQAKSPKLRKTLKLSHMVVNRSHMQMVMGLGRRYNRRIQKRSLLEGIDKVAYKKRKNALVMRDSDSSLGSVDLEPTSSERRPKSASFLDHLFRPKKTLSASASTSMRSLAAKTWFSRSNPGSRSPSISSRCPSMYDSVESLESVGSVHAIPSGSDKDSSKASLLNVVDIDGKALANTFPNAVLSSVPCKLSRTPSVPVTARDLKATAVETDSVKVKTKRFSLERIKRSIRRKTSIRVKCSAKNHPQIVISPPQATEAVTSFDFIDTNTSYNSDNSPLLTPDDLEQDHLSHASQNDCSDDESEKDDKAGTVVTVAKKTSLGVRKCTTEVVNRVLAPDLDALIVVSRKTSKKIVTTDETWPETRELKSSDEFSSHLTGREDLGADVLVLSRKTSMVTTDEICLLDDPGTCSSLTMHDLSEDQTNGDDDPVHENDTASYTTKTVPLDNFDLGHFERIFYSDDEGNVRMPDNCKSCTHLHEQHVTRTVLSKSWDSISHEKSRRKYSLNGIPPHWNAVLLQDATYEFEDLPRCLCWMEPLEGIMHL